jgi:hypothetical protein
MYIFVSFASTKLPQPKPSLLQWFTPCQFFIILPMIIDDAELIFSEQNQVFFSDI